MAADPDAPSRMEVLVLSTLARRPMHGYDIKLELRYKHVRWWASCEHGHLYATLARLEKRGWIAPVPGPADRRNKKVLALTDSGRGRLVATMEAIGRAEDNTYFDVDLFLSASFALERDRVLEILRERRATLEAQRAEAEALRASMAGRVPRAAELIMEHRSEHFAREAAFVARCEAEFAAMPEWGSFLGNQPISAFVQREGVPLER